MKGLRWIGIGIGAVVLLLLLLGGEAMALKATAGTVTTFSNKSVGESGVMLWQVSYVTHASAGTFTAVTDEDITGWILIVETDPGATAPTTLYDIVLNNSNSRDVMGGALANRSATVTEAVLPLQNGNYTAVFNEGPLTIQVTAAGNSKTAELLIYYLP